MFFIDESERVYSKSETIGVIELRQLQEMISSVGRILTQTEYQSIMAVFGQACGRALKENGLEEKNARNKI